MLLCTCYVKMFNLHIKQTEISQKTKQVKEKLQWMLLCHFKTSFK